MASRASFLWRARPSRSSSAGFIRCSLGQKLAFVAYLVAVQGLRSQSLTASAALLEEVAKLFAPGGDLSGHSGVLLEVEDPRKTLDPELMREQLARVRLFSALAERETFVLRGLDFPYRQPLLHIPRASEQDREIPLLLMFAQPPSTRFERVFSRERVEKLLDFIYGWLYPESYSEIEEENVEYRRYVAALHTRISRELPASLPTLDFGEIQRLSEGSLVGPQEPPTVDTR